MLERVAARCAEHLEGEQGVLEVADRALAMLVVALELVQRGRQFRAARAQARKQQLVLLAVVHALGELVDVEQHRPQQPEIRQLVLPAGMLQQQRQRAQHGGQRGMFLANHGEGGCGHGRGIEFDAQ